MNIKNITLTAFCITALQATTCLAATAPAPAAAASTTGNFYGKIEGGIAVPTKLNKTVFDNKKTNTTSYYGAGIGYGFTEKLRGDVLLSRINNSKVNYLEKKTAFKTTLATANAYYDLGVFNGFTPYLTTGVGFARNDGRTADQNAAGESNALSAIKNDIAWTVGLGTSYKIDKVILDFGYKFNSLGKATIPAAGSSENKLAEKTTNLRTHLLTAGLRVNF